MDGTLNADQQAVPTPRIRQDLNLYPAGTDETGAPIWHLHDPLASRFYRMQEHDIELLALIGHRSAMEISEAASRFIHQQVTDQEVEELIEFLRRNNLVVKDDIQDKYYQISLASVQQRPWWELAVRNPLFFRIPLWNPDRFLDITLPYVSWMTSRAATFGFVLLGFLGFFLLLRQFDQFFATFMHFFNWSGLATYLVVLLVVKVFHELGHAYTAKQMGCRVPTIGVAFMVGWPILFTDTSDAWKLQEKSRRLRIGAAGMSVELGIAVISLFLWSVTPDGPLRSAFFLLATTTWVMSVFVNLNPLMKFDGYYLLSDLIDTPNLEQRSFALARWWLRKQLFGLPDGPPEAFKPHLVVFAFGVWTYRFLLFLGIALLVYGFFFKAAGIALFILEIIYFIARPIFNEVKEWWKRRGELRWNRETRRTTILLSTGALLLFVPWYSDVTSQAVLSARHADLYLPVPGRLISAREKGEVKAGDVLFEFESPELSLRIQEARNRYEELSWIRASQGFNQDLRSEALIVESELRTQNQLLRSLVDQQEQLIVTAPFNGELVDRDTELYTGDWFSAGHLLGTVVDNSDVRVTAFLPESQLSRIAEAMEARFYPENPEHGVIDLAVDRIELMGSPALDSLYVASTFGGDVAVRENQEGEMLTVQSHYRIRLLPVEPGLVVNQAVRGRVVIDGYSESLFNRMRKRFVSVFIRETGF